MLSRVNTVLVNRRRRRMGLYHGMPVLILARRPPLSSGNVNLRLTTIAHGAERIEHLLSDHLNNKILGTVNEPHRTSSISSSVQLPLRKDFRFQRLIPLPGSPNSLRRSFYIWSESILMRRMYPDLCLAFWCELGWDDDAEVRALSMRDA